MLKNYLTALSNIMKCLIIAVIILVTNLAIADNKQRIALVAPQQHDIKKLPTNDLFKSYLEASSFRNKILSQNVANINTPSYKADEVAMPSSIEELVGEGKTTHKVRMNVTSRKHLGGAAGAEGKFSSHKLKDPDEVKKNGNNVSMRQQMTKLAQNKTDYSAAVKAYATINSLYSSVIGK